MDEQLITSIQQAQTDQELDQLTDRYREYVLTAYPTFRMHYGFSEDLHEGRYSRALDDVKRAAIGRGDRYQDVIRVLELAVEKHLALIKE
ncbi:MAG: hypothetical protein V4568_08260 [Pseudomonadota bacterium]